MSERRPTPDLMQDLMAGTQTAIKPATHKEIKPVSNNYTNVDGKEKATFNLSLHILTELEDKWVILRKLTGSKQISKTLIVEAALEIALAEFAEEGQESKLYRSITTNKAII